MPPYKFIEINGKKYENVPSKTESVCDTCDLDYICSSARGINLIQKCIEMPVKNHYKEVRD